MRAFWALYLATARQFRRDRMALLFTLLLPLLMTAFFGLIFADEPTGPEAVPAALLYVPGMLAIAILWLGVFGTAPPLVQLRELQVLRRVHATPLNRSTLLAAQLAFRVSTGLVQAAILIAYGMVVYGMRLTGRWPLVIGVILLGSLLFVTIGCLLASLARTNEAVVALGQVVQFPMMFLSGTLFPIEMLPDFLRPVSAAMPLTYLGDALRQSITGAPGLYPLWLDLAVLGGMLLVGGLLTTRIFRWE